MLRRFVDSEKKESLAMERRDWKNAICSVCLEFPHNAVLLLCSSHEKGCRPYMCDTGNRFSNCLDQFKKAYAKEAFAGKNPAGGNAAKVGSNVLELTCPLCRGQVLGWTVVEPARKYLNKKKKSCMQEDCSFRGTHKKLRKHVREKHAYAKPRTVDPVLEKKWKMLENQSEREDVMSVIRSTMPGAVVQGDYVLDYNSYSDDFDDDSSDFDQEDLFEFRTRVRRRGHISGYRGGVSSVQPFVFRARRSGVMRGSFL